MGQNAQICVSGKTLPGIKITKVVPNVVTLHNMNKIKHSNVNKLFLKVKIYKGLLHMNDYYICVRRFVVSDPELPDRLYQPDGFKQLWC